PAVLRAVVACCTREFEALCRNSGATHRGYQRSGSRTEVQHAHPRTQYLALKKATIGIERILPRLLIRRTKPHVIRSVRRLVNCIELLRGGEPLSKGQAAIRTHSEINLSTGTERRRPRDVAWLR